MIRPHEQINPIDKKEHKLYRLYPLADWILNSTRFGKLNARRSNITDSVKALYNTSKPEQIQRLFWCNRIASVIIILVLFDLLSLFSQLIYYDNSVILDGRYLKRPDLGEGSRQVELDVIMEKEGTSPKEEAISQKVNIEVEERTYTDEELKELFKNAFLYLKTNVLGKNESAQKIYHNLNLCKSIPGTNITVNWEPEETDLIEADGTLHNESIDKSGVETAVTLVLSYHNKKEEHSFSFRVMPKHYSKDEILAKKLEEKLMNAYEKSSTDKYLALPDSLDDYKLNWLDGKKENNSTLLLLFGVLMAIAAWVAKEKELEKQMKQRKEQMLLDYPELVNKFTLLVNAGMTIKQAWNKIAEDYLAHIGKEKCRKRYAYEEMLTTANEIKLGIPENTAYEQYGRRIGMIPYIKFSSLISQNLKKGNKGFTDLLMKEALEAFEERKEVAKRLGEEAGTKLLIPMMLMLILVFLIIMIPAFMAFRV